jgi:hypothetical protein
MGFISQMLMPFFSYRGVHISYEHDYSSGAFIACSNCVIPSHFDVTSAEAMAAWDGLLLPKQVGYDVPNLRSLVIAWRLSRPCLLAKRQLLTSNVLFSLEVLPKLFLFHRESNRVAHTLPYKAEGPHTVWMEDMTDFYL